jgi:hypothetical protein
VGIRLPLGIALIAGGLLADAGVLIFFGMIFVLGGLWGLETISRDNHL